MIILGLRHEVIDLSEVTFTLGSYISRWTALVLYLFILPPAGKICFY